MNKVDLKIYWREALQSYLPALKQTDFDTIVQELDRHALAVKQGALITFKALYEHHMERITQQDGSQLIRRKAESASVLTHYDSLLLLDQKLQEALGSWIRPGFCYQTLYPVYNQDEKIVLPEVEKAARELFKALQERHDAVDRKLKEIRSPKFALDRDNGQQKIASVIQMLVEKDVEETGCDDRWFYGSCENISIFLESFGFHLTTENIDDIADHHFSSWVDPETDAVQLFSDEIAALVVKQLFSDLYGTSLQRQISE